MLERIIFLFSFFFKDLTLIRSSFTLVFAISFIHRTTESDHKQTLTFKSDSVLIYIPIDSSVLPVCTLATSSPLMFVLSLFNNSINYVGQNAVAFLLHTREVLGFYLDSETG